MRSALVALATVGVAIPVWADWTEFGKNAMGDTYYLDVDSISTTGDTRRVWTLTDYQYGTRDGVRSTRTYREFDCAQRRHRFLQSQFYTGQKGSGEHTSVDQPQPWKPVPADSPLAKLLEFVCSR